MWIAKRRSQLELHEVRDPRAATLSPVSTGGFRRHPKWNASKAFEQALYQNIYVYACARARAQDLSSLAIRVGADPDKPRDFDRNHPLYKLLGPAPGGPTMNLSARRLVSWVSMQFDIAGRFALEIAPPATARRDQVPFELWPLVTSRLWPIVSHGGAEWFQSFEYEVNNVRRPLTRDQVLYYWRPKQNEFREPESLLEAASLNVSIAVMQDRYDHAFLINDARPAAVVVHEQFSRKAERNSFRRQFLQTHRGPDNAGKVAFVETSEDGAQPKDSLFIQQLGLSQRDAEFIERYENQIRAICVAMATPLSRLADSSRRTYANAERETKNYWRNAIAPQALEVAEAFNIGLMPLLGDSNNVCWFDTTGIPELEPPRRYAVGDIPDLIAARVITRNEARTGLELPEVDGGDDWDDSNDEPAPAPSARLITRNEARAGLELSAAPVPAPAVVTKRDPVPLWEAIVHNGRQRQTRLSERQTAAIQSRQDSKRGRQAMARDATAAELFDRTFWFEQAEEEFRSVAAMVALATFTYHQEEDAVTDDSVRHWCDQWAARMADYWVRTWMDALNVPIGQDISQMKVDMGDLYVRAMWESCSALVSPGSGFVNSQTLSDALVQLQRGDITGAEALSQLAT